MISYSPKSLDRILPDAPPAPVWKPFLTRSLSSSDPLPSSSSCSSFIYICYLTDSTVRPTEGLISLGTSDVVLVSTSSYNPHPEYHAFFHPAQIAPPSGDGVGGREKGKGEEGMKYFNMLVYKSEFIPGFPC